MKLQVSWLCVVVDVVVVCRCRCCVAVVVVVVRVWGDTLKKNPWVHPKRPCLFFKSFLPFVFPLKRTHPDNFERPAVPGKSSV